MSHSVQHDSDDWVELPVQEPTLEIVTYHTEERPDDDILYEVM